jgi:5-methylcytosine-specific restriction endonuclease McrA
VNVDSHRICLREPILEISEAARYLDDATRAHLEGKHNVAEELIRNSDIPAIRQWTESIWGKVSPYLQLREVQDVGSAPTNGQQTKERMPNAVEKRQLHQRDGYHCRFCGIPVIRKEIRKRIKAVYPDALSWGRRNSEQHAAFQAMWAQYDHLTPHAFGGTNDLNNLVVTCAPCNFGRMSYTLEQVGLIDPRSREPMRSNWDGLERFR